MKDKKEIFDMLKNWKIKKDQALILLLLGILLLVISLPSGKRADKEEDGEKEVFSEEGTMTEQEYISYTERHLENILSRMEGVGDVTVMITLRESAEKVVEKDTETSDETVSEEDSQGGQRTTKNRTARETTIYDGENDHAGQNPYVSKELTPKVEGIVVVAQGGENAVVIKNITEVVQALFGIDTHKIKIVKKE